MRKTNKQIVGLALIALFIVGGLKMAEQVAAFGVLEAVTTEAVPVKAEVAGVQTRLIDKPTLDAKMASILKQYAGMDVSIAITDLENGQAYRYGKTETFEAASTMKVLSAAMFLHEVERETFTLNQSIDGLSAKEQLRKMIVASDNSAWHSINTKLTSEELQIYAKNIGLNSYRVKTNTITASDTALLLKKLYTHELLNKAHTGLLLSYMKVSVRHEFVSSVLTSGTTIYHKAGWLSDRFLDAAIIDGGAHAYVLVIFSKTNASYNTTQGKALFNAITKASSPIFLN